MITSTIQTRSALRVPTCSSCEFPAQACSDCSDR